MPISVVEKSVSFPLPLEPSAGGPLMNAFTVVPPRPASPPPLAIPPSRPPRVITTRPQLAISDQELRARLQWSHKTSSHFALAFDRIGFADAQANTLLESLEEAYGRIFSMTHEAFPDRLRVYLIDQRATSLLGRAVKPHLDREERAMYLVESSSHSASSDILRLLTHAMRLTRCAKHYETTPGWSYLEEAFSVFLSARLSAQEDVFPFYGAEADVIAHYLSCNGEDHRVLHLWQDLQHSISLEETVLTGAFFLYLGDTHSDDLIVTFSKMDDRITTKTFKEFFGNSLEELEEQWTEHLPVSLLALTQSEQEKMIEQWQRAIEPLRFRI